MPPNGPLTLATLAVRVRTLEDRARDDDGLHRGLTAADGQTAAAVGELTKALNDPKTGLIVEVDRFRAEVVADRAAFRAWIRGAVAVLSVVFALFTILAPWIRSVLGISA
jgi:hypothetical protein